MAIKNKDGTVYKISGPNPLMNQQDFWGDYKKHNFDWLPEVVKDGSFKILQDDISKEIKIEIKEEPDQKKSIEDTTEKVVEKKINVSKNIKMIQCFCLPAKNIERKDSLYGEVHYKTEYLDKTIIEIVILEKEDLYIKIWCNEKLTEKSILYPRNKDKRWWRVTDTSNAPIGYYYMATVSDYTPSFE